MCCFQRSFLGVDFFEYLSYLEDVEIDNYQQLDDLIYGGDFRFYKNFFISHLDLIKSEVERLNQLGVSPKLYTSDKYNESEYGNFEISNFVASDKKVDANELLFISPLAKFSMKKHMLSGYSLYKLKTFLSHCDSSGKNVFKKYFSLFKNDDIESLFEAIKFYEEQVIRQYQERESGDIRDLFHADQTSKIEIVKSELKDIAEYLTDSADICVWGSFTDKKKQYLMNSLNKQNKAIENFVLAIANYTTLPELEKGVVKTKVLDRFIKS